MTHLHYFLTGNTAAGYKSFIPETLHSLQYLSIIDGPYLLDNTDIIDRIYTKLENNYEDLELIHHPSAPNKLLGIIIPKIEFGIFLSTPPHRIDTELFKGSITTLNVYDFYEMSKLESSSNQIEQLSIKIIELHQDAYQGYQNALKIHDEWEKIYILQSDFAKANHFTDELAIELLPERVNYTEEPAPNHKIRFLGAATPEGAVDFVPNLTDGLKRYFIKGRPGSGKSTLLRKLVKRGTEQNYELEIYNCGLDPNSLDMIICRELGFAIFDSTAPHEYYPSQSKDSIIDMYQIAIKHDTDQRFQDEINEIATRYRAQMKLSNDTLAQVTDVEHERQQLTQAALNIEELNKWEELIINYIQSVSVSKP